MNKKKLILGISLFLLGCIITVISLKIYTKVSLEIYAITALSSALPNSLAAFTFSKIIPEKYKAIKYLLYAYIFLAVFVFSIVCIFVLTGQFHVEN